MAHQEHLTHIQQGAAHWSQWRHTTQIQRPDLFGAKLPNIDLRGADLQQSNLSQADLRNANLIGADLRHAVLIDADLRHAKLHVALFNHATLRNADLRGAELSNANLTDANLCEADLRGANLQGANFNHTLIGATIFDDIDFRSMRGIENMVHQGPSTIGIDALYRSQGKIPETFLRGAGIPDDLITHMHVLAQHPVNYETCSMSYAQHDHEFAKHLCDDLQQKGVRCWSAPEDSTTGDRLLTHSEGHLRRFDKLLFILSSSALASVWSEREVEMALAKEAREHRTLLLLVRLDDSAMFVKASLFTTVQQTHPAYDFSDWRNPKSYHNAFQKLLKALQSSDPRS